MSTEILSRFIAECKCHEEGVEETTCDKKTGVCACKKDWFGDKCQGKEM